jgi:hypothetical protein
MSSNHFKITSSGILNTNTKKLLSVDKFYTKKGNANKNIQKIIQKLKANQLNDLIRKQNMTPNEIRELHPNFVNSNMIYDKGNKRFYHKDTFFSNNSMVNRIVADGIVETTKNSMGLGKAHANKIMKHFQDLSKGKIDEFQVDLRKITMRKVMDLRRQHLHGKHIVGEVDGRHFTFSENSRNRFTDVLRDGFSGSGGSDEKIIFDSRINPIMTISHRKGKKKLLIDGAFFNKYNMTKIDLSRYQIFQENDPKENYDDNCLIFALKQLGLSETKLNNMKTHVINREIPTCKLNEICKENSIQIHIIRDIKDKPKLFKYGNIGNTYKLCLLNNHFFINEKINKSIYCLRHYDLVKDEPDFERIYAVRNGYFERRDKEISSYKFVKELLKHNKLLKTIEYSDNIANTQYYDQIPTYTNLDYPASCIQENELKIPDYSEYHQIFFDFETFAKRSGWHHPYLACFLSQDKKRSVVNDVKCGKYFLQSLPKKEKIMLIAHNARYDMNFIGEYLHNISPCIKGNRLMFCKGHFYRWENGESIKVELIIKCSLNMINMALSKFGKCFNLPQEKEIMPYDIYNEKTLDDMYYPLLKVKESKHIKDDDDYNQFLNNCRKWGCINGDKFNIVEYSRRYCEIDCKVLRDGYLTYRKWMLELTGIDINNVVSGASLAEKFLIKEDCYEGVYKLSGIPRAFIQQCVVGGRTMTNSNQMYWTKKELADFDAVSLYPSAMVELGGFLKGTPKVLKNLDFNWLQENTDGYFIDILIKSVGIRREFPLMSKINDKGVRIFSNDMVGNTISVDKITLEDLIKFQDITFDVIRGYYYDEGRNTQVSKTINKLFNARLKLKDRGNPSQQGLKDIMNSAYGKNILKPIEVETKVIHKTKWDDYLDKYYNYLKEWFVVGDTVICKKYKVVNKHFNNVHVGVEILSMSKRIMNRVMCLAEDLGIKIYYQDTDSMHLEDSKIKKLAKAYKKKYNKVLIGKGMGQFHTDFDMEDCKDIVAIESIFLGKKSYIDKLKGINIKTGEIEYGYHIRLKGIPQTTIDYVCELKYGGDPMKLYEDMYNGSTIHFDLLESGRKHKFKYEQYFGVRSMRTGLNANFDYVSEFTREVQFNETKKRNTQPINKTIIYDLHPFKTCMID